MPGAGAGRSGAGLALETLEEGAILGLEHSFIGSSRPVRLLHRLVETRDVPSGRRRLGHVGHGLRDSSKGGVPDSSTGAASASSAGVAPASSAGAPSNSSPAAFSPPGSGPSRIAAPIRPAPPSTAVCASRDIHGSPYASCRRAAPACPSATRPSAAARRRSEPPSASTSYRPSAAASSSIRSSASRARDAVGSAPDRARSRRRSTTRDPVSASMLTTSSTSEAVSSVSGRSRRATSTSSSLSSSRLSRRSSIAWAAYSSSSRVGASR